MYLLVVVLEPSYEVMVYLLLLLVEEQCPHGMFLVIQDLLKQLLMVTK
jgi:hypothetical protein